jgi:hypothetical protein
VTGGYVDRKPKKKNVRDGGKLTVERMDTYC